MPGIASAGPAAPTLDRPRAGSALRGGRRLDPHAGAVLAPALVLDRAVDQREQRPVAPDPDVRAGMDAGADLAHQDVPRLGLLPAVHLDAAALSLAVAAVAARALSLLVGHCSASFYPLSVSGPSAEATIVVISVTLTVVRLWRWPRRRR